VKPVARETVAEQIEQLELLDPISEPLQKASVSQHPPTSRRCLSWVPIASASGEPLRWRNESVRLVLDRVQARLSLSPRRRFIRDVSTSVLRSGENSCQTLPV
jgi:hypothetical protein